MAYLKFIAETRVRLRHNPELRLLLLLAAPAEPERNGLEEIAAQSGWQRFLFLASIYHVAPLLWHNRKRMAGFVPEDVLRELEKRATDAQFKQARVAAELVGAVTALAANGVQCLVLKGITMAIRVYGGMAARPQSDNDVLIEEEQLDEAVQALRAGGWKFTDGEELYYENWRTAGRYNKHLGLARQGIRLELHVRTIADRKRARFGDDEFETGVTEIGGCALRSLALPDLTAHLAAHGLEHAFLRLKWLLDIAWLFHGQDMAAVLKRADYSAAEKQAVNTAVLLAVALDVLDEGKQTLLFAGVNSARICALAGSCRRLIEGFYGDTAPKITTGLYFFAKRHSFLLGNFWRPLAMQAFYPSLYDLRLVRLPRRLFFLYFFMRPFTWLARTARSVALRIGGGACCR